MSDLVIETSGLRKVFGSPGRRVVAVDGLDLSVPAGGVHGFLGANSSGKTTTLRMLLGLARPTDGTARLFGLDVRDQLAQVIDRVGATVEEPCFVPSFTGRKNLRLLARSIGLPRSAVDGALDQVGLGRGRASYGSYSLGMQQRLGIASALLKSPDLLILDEPTNGLDPAGMRDIRELIRQLGASGVTVLLSSHNLAEVQQVCQSVSVIDRGKLVSHGRVSELLGEQVSRTRVEVTNPDEAARVLTEAGHVVSVRGDHLLVEGHQHPEQITQLLAEHHLYVHELSAIRPTLESFFLDLTGRPPGGEAAPEPDEDKPATHPDDEPQPSEAH